MRNWILTIVWVVCLGSGILYTPSIMNHNQSNLAGSEWIPAITDPAETSPLQPVWNGNPITEGLPVGHLPDDSTESSQADIPMESLPIPPSLANNLICIDPGHQRRGNREPEAAGPDSSLMKDKVTSGTVGVKTKKPEYELTLEIGLKLRDRLTAMGYPVVMTREIHDVDISNKERAMLCNEAGAVMALRLHADGATAASARGISVLYPASSSNMVLTRTQAVDLLQLLIQATGANSRGVVPRSDLTGFNWSTVPSLLVEMGFMTNPEEDMQLADSDYQDRLVEGMVQFISLI